VYIGRRPDLPGFDFAGIIADVQIYSRALSKAEIGEVMLGAVPDRASDRSRRSRLAQSAPILLPELRGPYDTEIPLAAASLGLLIAVACMGLWREGTPLLYSALSFAAGLLLLPATAPDLPSFNLVLIPLTSLAGGASAVLSARQVTPNACASPPL